MEPTTDELIDTFMAACSEAELEPSEDLLRTMQEICASLSRSTANAWSDAHDGELDPLHSELGLDESTFLPDDEHDLTTRTVTVRDLLAEARGYIRLSLFDLAEGAVSRAMLVLRQRGEDRAAGWAQPATHVDVAPLEDDDGERFVARCFEVFSSQASGGWWLDRSQGRRRLLDHRGAVIPDDSPEQIVAAAAAERLAQSATAFGSACTFCLGTGSSVWLCASSEHSSVMLRFPSASLGRLISRLRQLEHETNKE